MFLTDTCYSFRSNVCKTVRPMLSDFCLPCMSSPVCLSATLVYCGQTAGWIKIKPGTQVGLGPGLIVLDGNPAARHPQRGTASPIFGPYLLWPKGWMDHDGTWHRGGTRSRPHYARWGPSSPPQKGGGAEPLIFGLFLWPNGCMYHDTTQYGGMPQPRRHCVRWGPGSLSRKGAQPPIFGQCPLWANGWMD